MVAARRLGIGLLVTSLLVLGGLAPGASAAESASWKTVDQTLGREGRDLPAGIRKYAWPRGDLQVKLDGVLLEPSLALTSWAAFSAPASDGTTTAMGDLVLLGSEVGPVIAKLQQGRIEVLALHNHLIGEAPRVLYLHFMGRGSAVEIARTLHAALAATRTPQGVSKAPAKPSAAEEQLLENVAKELGRKGSMHGRVLQIGIPRRDEIRVGGRVVPPTMGVANGLNFQPAGSRVAATGDFVLVADEVNPVIHELESHGIAVEALHNHMLEESPRLFFLHFWALGAPEPVAKGLAAALAKVRIQ